MIFLSRPAIIYAILMCNTQECYHVNIAVNSNMLISYTRSEIQKLITTYDRIEPRSRISNNLFHVLFENGSTINVFRANEASRGRKCDILIVDESVDNKIIETVLMPAELPWRIKKVRNNHDW